MTYTKEQRHAYYIAHKTHLLALGKKWHEQNKESYKKWKRDYYAQPKWKEYYRQYYLKHPEKYTCLKRNHEKESDPNDEKTTDM